MILSFIIPAYNASSTVVRTLDSIYNLPLKEDEFEVIVVDDCSTDNTLAILQDYASKQKNMLVLHQEQNHRQGAARNRGLKLAKGQYIMFVDADDVVEKGLIPALTKIEERQCQVLICDYDWQLLKTNEIEHRTLNCDSGVAYDGIYFLENLYDTRFCSCPINYIWSREFLLHTGVSFIEDKRMEDIDWIEKVLLYAPSIIYEHEVIYKVIGHEQSTTHTTDVGTIADWLHFCYRRIDFAESIRDKLPKYYQKVMEDTPRFVVNNTRFRLLTRFSPRKIHRIYARTGKESISFLRRYDCWPLSTKVFISIPILTQLLALLLYPIAESARIIYRKIRYRS